MSGLINLDIGKIVQAGANIFDDLTITEEEKTKYALQEKAIDSSLIAGQIETNQIEAEHKSMFVAGWRPFMGWIGGFALGYKFLFHPLLAWVWCVTQAKGLLPAGIERPPVIDASELYPIIMGMLGLGTMRTVEGIKGVKSTSMSENKKQSGFKWPWSKN